MHNQLGTGKWVEVEIGLKRMFKQAKIDVTALWRQTHLRSHKGKGIFYLLRDSIKNYVKMLMVMWTVEAIWWGLRQKWGTVIGQLKKWSSL